MIYLMDTHILLWSFFEAERIPAAVRGLLEDPEKDICISQVSIWEISLKYGIGKLKLGGLEPADLEIEIEENEYRIISIRNSDLFDFYKLPKKQHKDPFDRLIIWQCIKNGFALVSSDGNFDEYKQYGLNFVS
jgi:PIN domain nuclease of toxin-antitoxin system